MCNHSYKIFSVNKKNHKCRLDIKGCQLPIDSDGKCIFHSSNSKWKQENDFVGYLKKYVNYHRENELEIDLREVYFIASTGNTVINYLDTISGANLEGSTFLSIIEMNAKNRKIIIPEKLALSNCTFHQDVIFKNCTFKKEVELSNSRMVNDFGILNLQFENCSFEKTFDFIDFSDFSFHLSIFNCKFRAAVLFEDLYKEDNDFDIMGNHFYEDFTFKSSDINTLVINFSDNFFGSDSEFQDVAFRGITLFNQPKVKTKLIFTGTTERKIFYGNTQFETDPDAIEGQIVFQQVNLMLIEANDLEQIRKLEKIGEGEIKKVVIGAGCIKYRWQSPVKTLKVGMKNAFIIEEFVRTFTIFLSNNYQKVIGIDVIERSSSEITFFYFSDEYSEADQINDLLFEGREEFFRIISNQPPSNTQSIAQTDLLNNFQTKLSQNASIIKILSEMQQQNWNLSDTQALLDSFAFEGEAVLSAEPFHLQLDKTDLSKILQFSQQRQIPINLILLTVNSAETMINIDKMNGNNIIQPKE